ncbi:hypothetical protein A7311_20595 [Paenibacillus polymyxa]|uniref:phospholipase D-like domain-containing protein n=1 Tax=Paenibacillus polymyxa TaxID=1406 RepID=UPI00083E5660|nr:phospholipase D-like domain-containing protein [Paenibacillus polymyxa]ODB55037.1 hypothetical protein A7311_20595 [Paenibacillus polymyxa]
MQSESIAKSISSITCSCSLADLERIVQYIRSGEIDQYTSLAEWKRATLPANVPLPLIQDLISQWRKQELHPDVIILIFHSAMHTKRNMEMSIPEVELAWSGPFTNPMSLARSNYALIKEMIERARREIFLVGYSFTVNDRTLSILDALAAAILRGCSVRIAFHDNGSNIKEFLANWKDNIPKPTMLKWIGNADDPLASLHAKLLIVDNIELYIGSANMTYHGMGSNIELGLRIEGETARKVSKHFFALEQVGELVKY